MLLAGCASNQQANKPSGTNATNNTTIIQPPPEITPPHPPPPAKPSAPPPVQLPVPKWCSVWVENDTLATGDEIFVLVNVSQGMGDSAGFFCNNTVNWTNASVHWTERQVFLGRGMLHKLVACEFKEAGNFSIMATIDNSVCASKRIFVKEPYHSIARGSSQRWDYLVRDWPVQTFGDD